jgi:hypothetical protein
MIIDFALYNYSDAIDFSRIKITNNNIHLPYISNKNILLSDRNQNNLFILIQIDYINNNQEITRCPILLYTKNNNNVDIILDLAEYYN